MAIARFIDCMGLALRASGLWLRHATLQNLIPSFPWIAPPCPPPWRNPRKGRDQILPSGSLSDAMAMGISGKVPGKKHPPPLQTHWEIQLPALVVLIRPRRADTTNDQPLSLLYPLPPRKKPRWGTQMMDLRQAHKRISFEFPLRYKLQLCSNETFDCKTY